MSPGLFEVSRREGFLLDSDPDSLDNSLGAKSEEWWAFFFD